MKIKYSLKSLIVLTTLVGIAVFLQLRIDRNIALIEKEVGDATSQMHADALPYSTTPAKETVVSLTGTDVDFTVVDLMLFRRKLIVNYKILTTITRTVPPGRRFGNNSTVCVEREYRVQIPRTATVNAGAFGYKIK